MDVLLLFLLTLTVGGLLFESDRRRKAIRRIAHDSLHDPMTGLPNRTLLEERLRTALARARRNDFTVAVLHLDLNRFRDINQSLGHQWGDEALRAIARRIGSCLREEDTLSRFGADEFGILLEDAADVTAPARVAERILSELEKPIDIRGREISVTAATGIALSVDGRLSAETIIRNAEVAMRRSKESVSGHYEIFDPSMAEIARSRLSLEEEIRRGLERDEFVLYFQPQVEVATGEVVGLEALARWQHPQHGMLSPDAFIPVAEQSGLILALGSWALHEACRVAARYAWRYPDTPLHVAVNVSGRQLQAQKKLTQTIDEALQNTGLDPTSLSIEITETMLVQNQEPGVATLRAIRDLGVGVALDDFGTGHSALSYLKYLPISMLKLDKVFIDGLDNDVDSKIVEWLIHLAKSLGMSVCAEGVEHLCQFDKLRSLNCDLAQGFALSRPLSVADLAEVMTPTFNNRNKRPCLIPSA